METNPFLRPPELSEKGEPSPERSRETHEFFGARIEQTMPGGAAEKAGLEAGDIVESVSGVPIGERIGSFSDAINTVTPPIVLTVFRRGSRFELPLHTKRDPETGRRMVGVEYSVHLFVQQGDEESGMEVLERLKGRYFNSKDEPICSYSIDLGQVQGAVVFGEPTNVKQREIRRIEFSAHGKTLDLLERYNHMHTKIILDSGVQGGKHFSRSNRVLLNNIEQPLYIHTLLHELTHADQAADEQWKDALDLYGLSDFALNPSLVFEINFGHRVLALGKKFPELVEGGDVESAAVALEGLAKKGMALQEEITHICTLANETLRREYEGQIQELRRVIDAFLTRFSSPSSEAEALDLTLPIPEKYRVPLVQSLERLGLKADFSRLKTGVDFYWLVGSAKIGIAPDLEVLGTEYDAKERVRRTRFRMPGIDRPDIILSTEASRERGEEISRQREEQRARVNAIVEAVEETVREMRTVELRPGLGVFDALSYPRWLVERDAERGALMHLREIRKEYGMDFLQELSRLTEEDRKFLAESADEEWLKTQPEVIRTIYEQGAEERTRRAQEGGAAVKMVRRYMELIGATHKAIRRMRLEQGLGKKKRTKKPDQGPREEQNEATA